MGVDGRGGGNPYNLTLGGTHSGWMGEMSVPMTSALGNSSPKSLGEVLAGARCRRQEVLGGFVHGPDACDEMSVSSVR